MKPIETVVEALSSHHCQPKKNGIGYKALCPSHDDRIASLSVSEGHDGRVLLKCFAGCEHDRIASALGLEVRDLFAEDRPDFQVTHSRNNHKPKKPETTLRPDIESVIVSCCDLLKREPGLQKRLFATRGVTFETARRFGIGYDRERSRWSIPIRDHEGVRAIGIKFHRAIENQEPKGLSEPGSQVGLFGFEHLTQGDPVVITEGEFDAMVVWQSTGINAVSGSGGAATVKTEWSGLLAGHPVILCLDNDKPGREATEKWKGLLGPLVSDGRIPSLRIVSEYPAGCKDATDILLKHGAEAVRRTIDGAVSWEQEEADDEHSLTDHGNAIRFKNQHGTDVRYCFPWDEWLIWNGKIWERDKLGKVFEKGKQTVRKIYSEAEKSSDPKRVANHANRSNSRRGISDMLILARSTPGIPILPEHLDTNPWIFNCQNGTYDLQNHTFYDHRREDYQTRMAPITYDEKAVCPTWEEFLETVFQKNTDLIGFMQRVIGYSLTGDVGAQKLFLLHGESGANGKTVLLKTVMGIMGPYATRVESDLLLSKQYEQHPTGKCDLFGARLALCSETGDGRRMAESLVKEITGGDLMKGRRMRQDFFSWEPTHKIFLLTNDRPVIQGRDDAIWRRIDLIPFNYQIPAADRIPNYERTLLVESSGIFNWALRGLRSYQDAGLMEPETVTKAVDDYRESSDPLRDWLTDHCELPREDQSLDDFKCAAGALWDSYSKYCNENRNEPVSKNGFWILLKKHRCYPDAVERTSTQRFWKGIRLKNVGKMAKNNDT